MRVDNQQRFEYLKLSTDKISNFNFSHWYLNIRGKYKYEVAKYIKSKVSCDITILFLESKSGWFADTRLLFKHIDDKYLFYWVEDHLPQISADTFNNLVADMSSDNVEYLCYSFFGLGSHYKEFCLIKDRCSYELFDVISYNSSNNKMRQKTAIKLYGKKAYIVSLLGIFSSSFFKKILFDAPFYRMRRWPKFYPFDFEQSPKDKWVLPFKLAVPNLELFCSIDDDNGVSGSSLVSRGLINYPLTRVQLFEIEGRGSELPKKSFTILSLFKKIPIVVSVYNFIRRIRFYL
jgi:hypothetical protein